MHDPDTLIASLGPFTLWHHDPCKGDHGDDSCGWFMRASHGDPKVLAKVRKEIADDFDKVFEFWSDDWDDAKRRAWSERKQPKSLKSALDAIPPDSVSFTGFFCPNGDPNYSVQGIALNMFRAAAREYFRDRWYKLPWFAVWRPWHRDNIAYMWWHAERWMRRHVYDILLFAENPVDSLRDGIVGTFGNGGDRSAQRDERIDSYAACVYGWILREQRPWYRHPRWHVHHWRLHVSKWWFVPRWLDRKLRPENYACQAAPRCTI